MMTPWRYHPWLNTTSCAPERRTRRWDRRSRRYQWRVRPIVALIEDRTLLTPTLTTLAVGELNLFTDEMTTISLPLRNTPKTWAVGRR